MTTTLKLSRRELDKYLVDLRNAFEADNLKLTEKAFNIIRSKLQLILSEIYQKGVLEANDITGIQSLNSEEVTVIRDKIVEEACEFGVCPEEHINILKRRKRN